MYITERRKDGLKEISCELLFQSYSDGEPFPDLDYHEIRQLSADGGKDEVSGWHFLSTLAAKTAA